MSQSQLHLFDQNLCWHVAYNTKQILSSMDTRWVTLLGEPLVSFVDAVGGRHHLDGPNTLLHQFDFLHIAWVIGFQFRWHDWVSLPQITQLWHDCTPEIISELSCDLVTPWWDFCQRMEEQLGWASLCFQDAVMLIADWARTIRNYLRAMGKRYLVPAPDGSFPSPGYIPLGDDREINGPSGARQLEPAPVISINDSSRPNSVSGHSLDAISSLAADVRRIADVLAPPDRTKADTPYVAERLGCSTTWVAEMVRKGEIPSRCIVAGTGNGRPWKFYRDKIDEWISGR